MALSYLHSRVSVSFLYCSAPDWHSTADVVLQVLNRSERFLPLTSWLFSCRYSRSSCSWPSLLQWHTADSCSWFRVTALNWRTEMLCMYIPTLHQNQPKMGQFSTPPSWNWCQGGHEWAFEEPEPCFCYRSLWDGDQLVMWTPFMALKSWGSCVMPGAGGVQGVIWNHSVMDDI